MPKTLLVLLMMVALLTVPPVAAARPGTEAANEKAPLTEEDIFSGTFHTLEQVTGLGILGLRILYETSGAQNFKEFAQALLTAYILRLDPQFILRGLYVSNLTEILHDFGLTPEQVKEAIELAKRQLKSADEEWRKRT